MDGMDGMDGWMDGWIDGRTARKRGGEGCERKKECSGGVAVETKDFTFNPVVVPVAAIIFGFGFVFVFSFAFSVAFDIGFLFGFGFSRGSCLGFLFNFFCVNKTNMTHTKIICIRDIHWHGNDGS